MNKYSNPNLERMLSMEQSSPWGPRYGQVQFHLGQVGGPHIGLLIVGLHIVGLKQKISQSNHQAHLVALKIS